jgi:hypothetical protein
MYLVWNQARAREEADGHLSWGRDLGDALGAPGTHVVALKIAYWIGL